MFERLTNSINEKVAISQEELEIIKSHFTPKKLRKRQYLLQEGDICTRMAFVEKGSLISYSIDNKGVQHVMQFAFEDYWISDLYSFFTKEPSRFNIEAMEDSELLLLDWENHHKLLNKIPPYESYTRILYQNAYIALQRRLEGTLGQSAEEKYLNLVNQHPLILKRVPLNLIASFLGVTPETLSRIRKQLSK